MSIELCVASPEGGWPPHGCAAEGNHANRGPNVGGEVVEVGPLGDAACPQTRRAATFPCPVHQATYVRHDELHSLFFLLHLPVVQRR